MTTRGAAGQVVWAGFPGTAPDPRLLERVERGELGGIVLFKRNLGTPVEVARLVHAFTERAPKDAPLLVAIDQEGGRVQRLRAPIVELPPARDLGARGEAAIERAAHAVGAGLAALGVTCNFAPVLDVDTNPGNPIIGDRSFGRTAAEVIPRALAFARGLARANVLSCGKHFPGHGDTELDSHLALPRVSHDRSRLDAIELAPFAAARDALPMLMTAHVVFDALDPGVPATLSRRIVTDLLRGELGYDGLVVSDDLEMKGVRAVAEPPAAAVRAIEAGCDALLVCSDVDLALAVIDALAAEGERSATFASRLAEGAERGLALRRRCPPRPVIHEDDLARALAAARELA